VLAVRELLEVREISARSVIGPPIKLARACGSLCHRFRIGRRWVDGGRT
jgi:hypothetical protein